MLFSKEGILEMRMAIKGIGIVGGFGCGISVLKQTLMTAEESPMNIAAGTKGWHAEMPVFLCETSRLAKFIGKKALRRMDHFSQMAVLGSYLAIEDAGLLPNDHQNLAVIVASGYGAARTTFSFLDSIFDDGDALAPARFKRGGSGS